LKVERSCGIKGGRWKGAAVLKLEGRKELRYKRWKVERSCSIKAGR
jgi:hypothetical protein